jgi:hypothetical protein
MVASTGGMYKQTPFNSIDIFRSDVSYFTIE